MSIERIIDPASDSEIAALLRDADDGLVILRSGGSTYQLRRVGQSYQSGDLDLDAWFRLLDGPPLLTADEAEEMIANIYRWREEGSRPLNRPRPWPETDRK